MDGLSAFVVANIIGIGSNLDNSGVGIAYGTEKIRFPHAVNFVINAVGFCFAMLGACMGAEVSHFLSLRDAELLDCVVLCAIGLFFWYSAYIRPRDGTSGDKVPIQTPGLRQGVLLGIALSFTNVASGFGATIANAATIWGTVISITIWGYIMMWLGNVVGLGVLARCLGRYSAFVAGLLLIGVGIHQVML